MTTKEKRDKKNALCARLFEDLIKRAVNVEELKRDLTELYFNYSHMVIHYQETHNGIAPRGNVDGQLYHLSQLVAICDTSEDYPLSTDADRTMINSQTV